MHFRRHSYARIFHRVHTIVSDYTFRYLVYGNHFQGQRSSLNDWLCSEHIRVLVTYTIHPTDLLRWNYSPQRILGWFVSNFQHFGLQLLQIEHEFCQHACQLRTAPFMFFRVFEWYGWGSSSSGKVVSLLKSNMLPLSLSSSSFFVFLLIFRFFGWWISPFIHIY